MALTTVSQHQIALTILLFTFLVAIKANSFCRTFLIAPWQGFAFNPVVTSIILTPSLLTCLHIVERLLYVIGLCRILTTYFAPITRLRIQKKKIALTVLLLKGKIFILQTPTLQDKKVGGTIDTEEYKATIDESQQ